MLKNLLQQVTDSKAEQREQVASEAARMSCFKNSENELLEAEVNDEISWALEKRSVPKEESCHGKAR